METSTEYLSYVEDMKNFRPYGGRKDNQDKFEDAFSAIYAKAQSSEIDLKNSQDFMQGLSDSELKTLQNYTGLADTIKPDSLTAEGAYNLLMHDYEQYDFNGDGTVEIGVAKSSGIVPSSMPNDVREAYVSAMNTLSDEDRLLSSMITLSKSRIEAIVTGEEPKEEVIDYGYLKAEVDRILDPSSTSSDKLKSSITQFWNAFDSSYTGERTSSEEDNPALQKFKDDLTTKGAMKFLSDMNKEKIEAKVEEYRAKLLKEMGDSPEALKEIEKLVAEYRKQLMEELENSLDADDKKVSLGSDAKIQALLDMQSTKKEPLKELLKKDK